MNPLSLSERRAYWFHDDSCSTTAQTKVASSPYFVANFNPTFLSSCSVAKSVISDVQNLHGFRAGGFLRVSWHAAHSFLAGMTIGSTLLMASTDGKAESLQASGSHHSCDSAAHNLSRSRN